MLATVYHVLGIDPSIAFPDHAGRPVPILDIGKPDLRDPLKAGLRIALSMACRLHRGSFATLNAAV